MITSAHEFLNKLPKKDLIDIICFLSGYACRKDVDDSDFHAECRLLIEEAYKEIKSSENG